MLYNGAEIQWENTHAQAPLQNYCTVTDIYTDNLIFPVSHPTWPCFRSMTQPSQYRSYSHFIFARRMEDALHALSDGKLG